MSSGDLLLSLDEVTRRFGDVVAVHRASLRVGRGEVHAVLGENGAGKTTLLRMAFGLVQPDSGSIHIKGKRVRLASPADAISHGVGMVHQHFTLVPAITVAENVALGGRGVFNRNQVVADIQRVATAAGLSVDPQALVQDLPVTAQQRVEIVKALVREVDVLILDEPTAVLAPQEAAELLQWARAFADSGRAVVLITHKLRDALSVADTVTVLRLGQVVLHVPAREATEQMLADAMLEGQLAQADNAVVESLVIDTPDGQFPIDTPASSSTSSPLSVLVARNVSIADTSGATRISDASFELHGGQIVGVAAIEGSGHRELLLALAGLHPVQSGQLDAPERTVLVPADRHHDALMLDANLVENIALQDAGARRGRMPWEELRERTKRVVTHFDVRTASVDLPVRSLSGGNQQKLVVGRALTAAPQAVVFDNPTRGLDFNATLSVHRALREAAGAGMLIIVHSSDLDELVMLADRMLVIHAGHVREAPVNRELVGRMMLGSAIA